MHRLLNYAELHVSHVKKSTIEFFPRTYVLVTFEKKIQNATISLVLTNFIFLTTFHSWIHIYYQNLQIAHKRASEKVKIICNFLSV